MADRPPILRRHLVALVATTVVLGAAAGLCLFGSTAVDRNHGGFFSWFNLFALASSGGSVILAVLVALAWGLHIDRRRRDQDQDQDRLQDGPSLTLRPSSAPRDVTGVLQRVGRQDFSAARRSM